MEYKKVSIIIPTWNRASIITKTVMSVVNQTYPIYEIIVIDDGSTDDSQEKLQELSKIYPNLVIVYQKNKGSQAARNKGLSIAKGDYIGFLDADDEYLPTKIEKQIKIFESKDVDIVSCYMKRVFPDGKFIEYTWYVGENARFDLFNYTTYVDSNSALFKKSCFKQNLFDVNCKSSQEWELHLRMSLQYRYETVREVLSIYNMAALGGNTFRTHEAEFNGLSYILKKYKSDWLTIVGRKRYFELAEKLLVYRFINSFEIRKFFTLLQVDWHFLFLIIKPVFVKSLLSKKTNIFY